ncbi:MAG: (d)CMP kinase [Isosphaeraceae bacterium]
MRVVTIDGPAGAGKSTVARRLAGRLGWAFLDTGAMYRAVTLAALRAGVDLEDGDGVGAVAERIEVLLPQGRVLLDGDDVTDTIRAADVTQGVRYVADSPRVRTRLVALQRANAAHADLVTEGRDQGTVVFPDALCKFFLTASPEVRAERRAAELAERGQTVDLAALIVDQTERDARDEARAIAPLRPASDAIVLDTTGLTLDDVLDRVEKAVLGRLEDPALASTARESDT